MKKILSPLGFDTSHILSLLVKYGIEPGDVILFLMSEKVDDRAEAAFENIREMIHKIDARIVVDRIRLDNSNFQGMITSCIDALTGAAGGHPDASLIVNLSGGPREILVALTIASVTQAPRIAQAACYSDVNRQLSAIDLPFFTTSLQEREVTVLGEIRQLGPASISEIANRLQTSESSVSRYCARLVSAGLIDLTSQGKSKMAKIKPAGEIALAIFRERQTRQEDPSPPHPID